MCLSVVRCQPSPQPTPATKQSPLAEVYSVALFAALMVTAIVWLLVNDLGAHFLYFYLIPYLIAGTCLAYSFDYAPHRPHAVDRYAFFFGGAKYTCFLGWGCLCAGATVAV